MSVERLSHFLNNGAGALPEAGDIAVFGAGAESPLSLLPKDRVKVVCRVKPDFDRLRAAGFDVVEEAPEKVGVSVVFLPRAKAQARAMVAQALAVSQSVIVDGQKADGIDSLLREIRKRTECSAPYSKAHGKVFLAWPGSDPHIFDDWEQSGAPRRNADGYVTVAGVFSADKTDPASKLLAAALPAKLKGRVADFGAGWGYLAGEVLTREDVATLDLVEADHAALDCAQQNVRDARARFHWADATAWRPEQPLDAVVMNPPFHEGRKGVPELGRGFIRNAAACLAPHGRLYMVANRHLPYEAELRALFREVKETGGDNRFKLIEAARPSRTGR